VPHRSGFVPIDFRLAGWVLVALGFLTIAVKLASRWTGSFPFPTLSLPLGLILAGIGAYLLWVDSRGR
jgi:hypothetical protein